MISFLGGKVDADSQNEPASALYTINRHDRYTGNFICQGEWRFIVRKTPALDIPYYFFLKMPNILLIIPFFFPCSAVFCAVFCAGL